ncbi:DUF4174 domain-containing protein [Falsihalocynthiibacter sp. SS001]|uniref:DUF4174 domain-containing protein n=1 Tax=Falsihalocynthiibacter sp. SS001 TaxID=3349698 RepID=UPI0036D2D620
MRFLILIFIGIFGASSATMAQDAPPFVPIPAQDVTLDEFTWNARPVLLFAGHPQDPQILRQLELLAEQWPALAERDVVVIVDTDPNSESDARLQIRPHGFMMVLLSKDGKVAQRKPHPWSARELIRAIDKMPLRIQEEKERRFLNPRPIE